MSKGQFPEYKGNLPMAVCFSIYDWEVACYSNLLGMIEAFFNRYGYKPKYGTGSHDDTNFHGSYSRNRRKIALSFTEAAQSEFTDIRVLSEEEQIGDYAISRCGFLFRVSSDGRKEAMFFIHDNLVDNVECHSRSMENEVLNCIQFRYGAIFNFPFEYGPEQYLSGINLIPKGESFNTNKPFKRRLDTWRQNYKDKSFMMHQGYFREIYPVNYFNSKHFENKVFGDELFRLTRDFGVLKIVTQDKENKLFKWTLNEIELRKVRPVAESLSIVLSVEV